ncbi:ABC transporter permease [Paramicrobacterium fandaimingii]|uniref:ABC transporter permease n=1 Tax=Paramicrobacterium fandaimingii TaxID=2708079 RepID=UPI00141EA1F0|nr:iron ABC transporter permease [Microbacterium fandaimingii]
MVIVLIVVIAVYFGVFALYPLLKLLFVAVFGGDEGDLGGLITLLSSDRFLSAFGNSILLGLATTAVATLVGFLFAYAVTRTNVPFKRFFDVVGVFPIMAPPFVLALALILLFGRNGTITHDLLGIPNSEVFGFHGLVIVQTLSYFPLAYLNLKGVLESLDSSVENAAMTLGAGRWRVFRTITFPLILPTLFSSLLIVFVKAIEDFGNPIVLGGQYNTLAVEAYLQIVGRYDTRGGAVMAMALILPALIAFVIQKYWAERKSYVTVSGKPSQDTVARFGKSAIPLFIFCLGVTVFVLLLYGTVIASSFVKIWGISYEFTLEHFEYMLSTGMDTVWTTLLLAAIATPITGLLGVVVAYLLVRKKFMGKRALEVSTALIFAVPGIVVGISYIAAFNSPPMLLTGTAIVLIIVFVTRNVPVGIEAGINSLRQIGTSMEEASMSLGASGFVTFRRVTLPLIRSALFSGLIYAFVKAMTSISAVIFLVSAGWNLMTVSILSAVDQSRFGDAAAYCTLLIAIVLVALGILKFLSTTLTTREWRTL